MMSPTAGDADRTRRMLRWRKGAKLGKGGSGTVFLALQPDTGALFAVKEVDMSKLSAAAVRGIRNEINTLRSYTHPNIVGYVGAQVKGSTLSILMEWVPGGSVKQVVRDLGPLPEGAIAAYAIQAVRGLGWLHKRGVIHCDVKPANLLIDDCGTLRLADFGTVQLRKELKGPEAAARRIEGSPYYMAPETIRGEPPSPAADVWGVGASILEMATGKPPWSERGFRDAGSLFAYIVGGDDRLPEVPATLSVSLRAFVKGCLTRDPSLRPSCDDLARSPFLAAASRSTPLNRAPSRMASLLPVADGATGLAATAGGRGRRAGHLGASLSRAVSTELGQATAMHRMSSAAAPAHAGGGGTGRSVLSRVIARAESKAMPGDRPSGRGGGYAAPAAARAGSRAFGGHMSRGMGSVHMPGAPESGAGAPGDSAPDQRFVEFDSRFRSLMAGGTGGTSGSGGSMVGPASSTRGPGAQAAVRAVPSGGSSRSINLHPGRGGEDGGGRVDVSTTMSVRTGHGEPSTAPGSRASPAAAAPGSDGRRHTIARAGYLSFGVSLFGSVGTGTVVPAADLASAARLGAAAAGASAPPPPADGDERTAGIPGTSSNQSSARNSLEDERVTAGAKPAAPEGAAGVGVFVDVTALQGIRGVVIGGEEVSAESGVEVLEAGPRGGGSAMGARRWESLLAGSTGVEALEAGSFGSGAAGSSPGSGGRAVGAPAADGDGDGDGDGGVLSWEDLAGSESPRWDAPAPAATLVLVPQALNAPPAPASATVVEPMPPSVGGSPTAVGAAEGPSSDLGVASSRSRRRAPSAADRGQAGGNGSPAPRPEHTTSPDDLSVLRASESSGRDFLVGRAGLGNDPDAAGRAALEAGRLMHPLEAALLARAAASDAAAAAADGAPLGDPVLAENTEEEVGGFDQDMPEVDFVQEGLSDEEGMEEGEEEAEEEEPRALPPRPASGLASRPHWAKSSLRMSSAGNSSVGGGGAGAQSLDGTRLVGPASTRSTGRMDAASNGGVSLQASLSTSSRASSGHGAAQPPSRPGSAPGAANSGRAASGPGTSPRADAGVDCMEESDREEDTGDDDRSEDGSGAAGGNTSGAESLKGGENKLFDLDNISEEESTEYDEARAGRQPEEAAPRHATPPPGVDATRGPLAAAPAAARSTIGSSMPGAAAARSSMTSAPRRSAVEGAVAARSSMPPVPRRSVLEGAPTGVANAAIRGFVRERARVLTAQSFGQSWTEDGHPVYYSNAPMLREFVAAQARDRRGDGEEEEEG